MSILTKSADATVTDQDKQLNATQSGLILLGLLVAVVGLVVVGLLLAAWLPGVGGLYLPVLIYMGLAAIFPISYLAYRATAMRVQQAQIWQDFSLLGLFDEARETGEISIEETPESAFYRPLQYWAYIVLILVHIALVLAFVLYHPLLIAQLNSLGVSLGTLVSAEMAQLVFFGFLGAYSLAFRELIRRYITFDLQPHVYTAIYQRFLLSLVVVLAGGAALLELGMAAGSDNQLMWASLGAFAFGLFPREATHWLTQRANLLLKFFSPDNEKPLRTIMGISDLHEARLEEIGIDNVQNLATVNLKRLLLNTKFDAQQAIHWIDQAILHVRVENDELLQTLRNAKITTANQLKRAASASNTGPLITTLGLGNTDELERLADFNSFPNYVYVREYYRNKATIVQQQTELERNSIQIKLGIVPPPRDPAGAVREAENLVQLEPENAGLRVTLATAYVGINQRDKARAELDQAIVLDAKLAGAYIDRARLGLEDNTPAARAAVISDTTTAININNRVGLPFVYRGLAYFREGKVSQALTDFNQAIGLNPHQAVAYVWRGRVHNARTNFEAALLDFERAFVLSDTLSASVLYEMWQGWGVALLGVSRATEAIEKFTRALEYRPQSDAGPYNQRGSAYTLLGDSDALRRALLDFETATGIDPDFFEAHYNLAVLQAQIGRSTEAIASMTWAVILSPSNLAARQALGNLLLDSGDPDSLNAAAEHFGFIINQAGASSDMRQRAQSQLDFITRLQGVTLTS